VRTDRERAKMKTLAALLYLIATTANAAPLYLKCEGKEGDPPSGREGKPAAHSVKIDDAAPAFSQVMIDAYPAGQFTDGDNGVIWTFGGGAKAVVSYGEINRVSGETEIRFTIPFSRFTGVCRKAEKLF
jgi:hypothetical protein